MRDIGLQQLKKSFVKSCYPIINPANTAVLAKCTGFEQMATEVIYRPLIDAVILLGNAVYDFSMKRQLLKTQVAVGYKSLCRDNQPVSLLLFGDELSQSIRDIPHVKQMSVFARFPHNVNLLARIITVKSFLARIKLHGQATL